MLGSHQGLVAGAFLLGICPPGKTWVIRDVVAYNASGAEHLFQLTIQTDAASFNVVSTRVLSLAAAHGDLRQAMNPDERLSAYSDSDNWQLVVTGYELTRSEGQPAARDSLFLGSAPLA